MKNKIIKIAAGIMTLSLILTGCGGSKPKNAIAKVGDKYITAEDVNTNFQGAVSQQMMYTGVNPFDESTEEGKEAALNQRKEILEGLIFNETALKLAESKKINIEEEEVEKAIDDQVEQAGGKEAVNEMLKAQGMTEEEFREEMKEYFNIQMTFSKLQEKLEEELTPSDKEIDKKLEEDKDNYLPVYNADHILYSTKDDTNETITDEAEIAKIKEEAQAVLEQVNSGEVSFQDKFDEIKNKNDASMENPSEEGEGEIAKTVGNTALLAQPLGDFGEEAMVETFTEAVKKMEPETINSELVETEFGYHIIRLNSKATEISEASEDYLKNVKAQISTNLLNEKINEEIEKEEKALKIKYYDKDGKEVDDMEKALKSFDFNKISEEQAKEAEEKAKKNEKSTEAKEEEKSTESTEQSSTENTAETTESTENTEKSE
ncbi:SurA N-terminal domain-containing protein [Miniphocaeibacter halophilus]|uniref:SurA N-terminal domain-containing protein n=1 Tax=Miniphocaeibacter halophilus TaxID=2931922 RepID=A0AC61N0L9_9FIRM|nr:SurA N-terminal domain-containing protein [Miniphocaeibacter halophilus]QQK08598.1 SurA N-terminal domain-containing protein [Miniphocaeibacter halophilus]